MAEPVPAADAALLAAQAKAGQAGVEAYKAAQQSMQQQRQAAVEQAMREAALRGAPTGAMESQQSMITGPYDQRIASLAQSQAAYEGDMAGRDRRMADYNANVNAARSFIPQQTEQAVAPIRARGEFEVRQQQIAGDRSVSEINANLRLTEARMAAAFQAAQIAAAKQAAKDAAAAAASAAKAKKNPLNQGELQSMLSAGAQERVGNVASQLSQITTSNRTQAIAAGQAAMGEVNAAARAALTPAQRRQQERENQAAETAFSTSRSRGSTSRQTQSAVAAALARTTSPASSGSPWDVFRGAGMSGGASTPAGAPPSFPGSPFDIFRDQGVDVDAAARQVAAARQQQTASDRAQIVSNQNRANISRLQQAFDPFRSQYGFVTPQQLSMFDPVDAQMVTNSPRFLGDDFDINRFIVGGSSTNKLQGASDPYSIRVMQDALGAEGDKLLGQGYEFDYPQFMDAISGGTKSLYNTQAEAQGRPSTQEDYAARIKSEQEREDAQAQSRLDRNKADADAADAAKQDVLDNRSEVEYWATHDENGMPLPSTSDKRAAEQADIDDWFSTNLGGPPPANLGANQQTLDIAGSPEFRDARAGILALDAFKSKGYLTPEEMAEMFNQAATHPDGSPGKPLSRAVRDLLRHYYQYDDEFDG